LAPAPFCGKILRDLGAFVIKIDKFNDPVPDTLSRGKQSIAINTKTKEGIEIVKRLTKDSDVLIEPFRKGIMEKMGLGPNVLCEVNPRLIYARLTGYGQFGDLAQKAGHDINYLAYSGVLSMLGRENEKPHAPINLLADFAGGGIMCAMAIISSLYERDTKTKIGKVLDCSMVEGAAYTASWVFSSKNLPMVWNGTKRGTNLLDGGHAAYDTYETKDAKFVAVGSLEPKFYEELLKGLNIGDADDVSKESLAKLFKTKTRDEWDAIFKDLDACVAPVLEINELNENSHNKERGSFIEHVNGEMEPTLNWTAEEQRSKPKEFPNRGQDSVEILRGLGYSAKEIEELVKLKVVQCAMKPKL